MLSISYHIHEVFIGLCKRNQFKVMCFPKHQKLILCFSVSLALFQSCIVYEKQPVSIKQASKYDDRRIKITTIDGNEQNVNWIEGKDENVVSIKNTKRTHISNSSILQIKTVGSKPTKISLDSAYNHKGVIKIFQNNIHGRLQSAKYINIKWDGNHLIGLQEIRKDTATVVIPTNQIEEIQIQSDRPLNNINLNLLGDAGGIAIMYERLFPISPNFFFTGKLGVGRAREFQLCFGPCEPPDKYTIIPLQLTGNIGGGRHFFEFGFGYSFIEGNTYPDYIYYPTAGYRFQPLKSGKVSFRIYASYPIGVFPYFDFLYVPVGLSLGISF